MSAERTGVLIASDHLSISQALAQVLGSEGVAPIWASWTTSMAEIHQAVAVREPRLLLLAPIRPLQLQPRLRKLDVSELHRQGTRVGLLADGVPAAAVARLAPAGTDRIWSGSTTLLMLVNDIREFLGGQGRPGGVGGVDPRSPDAAAGGHEGWVARLTPREIEVLIGLVEGKSAGEIASEQQVAVATVRTRIRAIFAKLEVNSQQEAAAAARRAGLFTS